MIGESKLITTTSFQKMHNNIPSLSNPSFSTRYMAVRKLLLYFFYDEGRGVTTNPRATAKETAKEGLH